MEVDLILDTNAVRNLGLLSDEAWADFIAGFHAEKLRTAWIPWVLAELIGSNLCYSGFNDEDVRQLQTAASRFDQLTRREILPSLDDIFVTSAYQMADLPAPPHRDRAEVVRLRHALDFFLHDLRSAEQVTSRVEAGLVVRLRSRTQERGWQNTLPRHFSDVAERNVAALAERIGTEKVREPEIVQLALGWYRRWLVDTAARLAIPTAVMESAWQRVGPEEFLASPCSMGLYEAWYYAIRAAKRKARIETNDGIDLHVAGYLPISFGIVTDDGALRRLLAGVIKDKRRIIPFDDFVSSFCASAM